MLIHLTHGRPMFRRVCWLHVKMRLDVIYKKNEGAPGSVVGSCTMLKAEKSVFLPAALGPWG
jgi:hypothetical protein